MQYELFYLVGSSKEGELETIKKEVAEIVTSEGGEFLEKQTEEKRKLSYEVKHETHGIYIAQRFELEDLSKIKEINQKLNLYINVLRFIITRANELPELLSKEERKSKADSFGEIKKEELKRVEESKPARERKETLVEEKADSEKQEKKSKDEDIDKKLEEILNI